MSYSFTFDPIIMRRTTHFYFGHEPAARDGHRHVYNPRSLACEHPDAPACAKVVGAGQLEWYPGFKMNRVIRRLQRQAFDQNLALDYPQALPAAPEEQWPPPLS
jgi:hypothetical protein